MIKRKIIAFGICLLTSPVYGFEIWFESSPAIDAIEYKKRSNLSLTNDVVLVDGAITSSPPDSTFYDRSFLTQSRLGTNLNIKNNLGLRLVLGAGAVIRKQEEAEEPRTLTMSERLFGFPTLEVTYYTSTNLELVVGARYNILNKFSETLETTETESETKYGNAAYVTPRVGVYKRGGSASGGFYFTGKSEAKRSVNTVAFDGTENQTEDVLFSPTTIGVMGRFKAWGYQTDAEFAAVQSGEGGNRTAEGKTVEEDHIRARLAVEIPLSGALQTRISLIHKTLSYSDNALVTLESIPMTTMHIKAVYGNQNMFAVAGISYGEGYDLQSLPEFNAKYLVKSYGATLAGTLSW